MKERPTKFPELVSSDLPRFAWPSPMIERLHEVIHAIEHQWPTKRLLVLGDVMLDRYIWGEAARISPEAPVPVVRAIHQSEQPGGAANVALNLARLGARVLLAGFVGNDAEARSLLALLASHGIDSALVACQDFPTTTKTRIVARRQQMLRLDYESSSPLREADYDRLLASVLAALPGCDAIVLSDYAKGVLLPRVCQTVIAEARRRRVPVMVDPKTADFSRYRGATTVCPNLQELAAACRLDFHNLEALLAAGERMVDEFDLDYMTATLSEKGIAVLSHGRRFVAPAQARQVFDVSGAGDTVIAVLALAAASELAIEDSAQLANVAAGIVVGKVGTAPVEKFELLAALEPDVTAHGEEKVFGREELANRAAIWRANGERVVFTNGCFDLLHTGHITVLEQARRLGARLIVGINSDASVSRLKGPARPVVGEHERARVLAALAAVDAVTIFDEATPLELVLALHPDVIVKGGDYTEETVVGAKEVKSWGGAVVIVPTVEGHSTTQMIERSKRD
jgi:D-beta-D-heptose 7-phosphate kinase / D-beta-D-heptose 1-phosphate adenosyltransferase